MEGCWEGDVSTVSVGFGGDVGSEKEDNLESSNEDLTLIDLVFVLRV